MQKLLNQYKLIIKYIAAAILLFVPLYPKFPLVRIPGSYVSIRFEDVIILISLFCVLPYFLRNIQSIFKQPLFFALFVYIIVGFASVFSGVFVTQTAPFSIATLHLLRRIEYILPLLFSYIAIKNDLKNASYFLNLIFLIVLVVFVYAVGQRFFYWPMVITQNQEYAKGLALRYTSGSHINSTFAGHYDLATFLVLVTPFLALSFVMLKNNFYRICSIILYSFSWWLLGESASRISVVAAIISISTSFVFIRKIKYIPFIIGLGLLFTLFSNNLFFRYKRIFDVIKVQIQEITIASLQEVYAAPDVEGFTFETPTPTPVPVFEDRSSSIRFNVEWPRALRAFTKNPVLGTGYSSITLATDNDYLRLLGETGTLGFLSFILIILEIFFISAHIYIKKISLENIDSIFVAGFFGGTCGILVNALFIDVFEASKFAIVFWFLAGIVFAIHKRSQENLK